MLQAASGYTLTGTVVNSDSTAAAGAVVYALDRCNRLRISNNTILYAENIPRAITDQQGKFSIENWKKPECFLLARDLEERCSFVKVTDPNVPISIEIEPPGILTGTLLCGKNPVKQQEIVARYLSEKPFVSYRHVAVTDDTGNFTFKDLMPGQYLVQLIHEVPQVGCCFSSVVTKQAQVEIIPGGRFELRLGGADLPSLEGKITDSEGAALHGVWVRLLPDEPNQTQKPSDEPSIQNVWSTVTDKEGCYAIYDIPPGGYTLRCFRRLALNNYRRTLEKKAKLTIEASNSPEQNTPAKNFCNVSIDLKPFMPLELGQVAPSLKATLLSGEIFDLKRQSGKVVVLHFYAGWCRICHLATPRFDKIVEKFNSEKVTFVSINLDNSLEDCRKFVAENNLKHPQIFDGPWSDSKTVKNFHIVDIPTTIIINQKGIISQIDLFDEVLASHIEKLLEEP